MVLGKKCNVQTRQVVVVLSQDSTAVQLWKHLFQRNICLLESVLRDQSGWYKGVSAIFPNIFRKGRITETF